MSGGWANATRHATAETMGRFPIIRTMVAVYLSHTAGVRLKASLYAATH